MAEIIKIEGDKVKIGDDGGKVITVPIVSVGFADPQVGDNVKVYQDGKNYIVTKESSATDNLVTSRNGYTEVNKHLFVWVFSFLLGGFGVDRFIRGQIGVGVCKLLFGWLTLGIWGLVDWLIALTKAYASGNNGDTLKFNKNGEYTK